MQWELLWFSEPFWIRVSTSFLPENPDISFTVRMSTISFPEYPDTLFIVRMSIIFFLEYPDTPFAHLWPRRCTAVNLSISAPCMMNHSETFSSPHSLGSYYSRGALLEAGALLPCCCELHLCKTIQVTGSPGSRAELGKTADRWTQRGTVLPFMFRGLLYFIPWVTINESKSLILLLSDGFFMDTDSPITGLTQDVCFWEQELWGIIYTQYKYHRCSSGPASGLSGKGTCC